MCDEFRFWIMFADGNSYSCDDEDDAANDMLAKGCMCARRLLLFHVVQNQLGTTMIR